MVIKLNCFDRADPADLVPVMAALAEAAQRIGVPHARLGAVLDWVQYRRNFRDVVEVRRFVGTENPYAEITIDVRRAKDLEAPALAAAIVERFANREPHARVLLERWAAPSQSIIWAFNATYWRHLSAWDSTFDKHYASALPGGVSDGTNPEFWRDRIASFVDTLEGLDRTGRLPDEIHVLEAGVGSGAQARLWLDTFVSTCDARGRRYPERLRYVMADFSADVLATARRSVEPYGDRVSHVHFDVRRPLDALAPLRGKVLFVHACNLYDNLPTDEFVHAGGRSYQPLVRAYLPEARLAEICASHDVAPRRAIPTIHALLRAGPRALGDEARGVRFWADIWDALRLKEVYTEADVEAGDVLESLPDWTRVHLSSVAIESFAQTLDLLHPAGVLTLQDLFVREIDQYASFRGPGKLEGSIVNWLNGPLFRRVARERGFDVDLEPFTYREGSNIVVLTAARQTAARPVAVRDQHELAAA